MKKPIVYLRIMGNCGNQFFQYAFARTVQERIGGELIIDYRWAREAEGVWPGSDDMLKNFNTVEYKCVYNGSMPLMAHLSMKIIECIERIFNIKWDTLKKYKWDLLVAKISPFFGVYYFGESFYPYKIRKRRGVIIYGYFESSKYFKEIEAKIVRELTPKHKLLESNQELFNTISTRPSVCISIKRMDVDNPETADTYQYDINYFYHAVSYIRSKEPNAVWIVFSDNIRWCMDNFHIDGEVYYETPNNPIWEKVRLMSACKHFIIHNSTFSWWVQHLATRKGKIVVAPVKWVQLQYDHPIDIYEDNWILMTNDGKVRKTHD